MEILYVGPERNEAQAIATALGTIDDNVTVAWTSRLDHVVRWIDEHRDDAALVVDAPVNGTGWRSVLKYAGGSRTALPIVVIVPNGSTLELSSLGLDFCDSIARTELLLRDLPVVVTRAIARARHTISQPTASTPAPSVPQPAETSLKSSDVEPSPVADREGLANHRQREETLEKLLDLERLARAELERQLAQATATLHEAERRHVAAMDLAAQQLAKSQSQYEIGIARASVTWEMVDEQLREAASEIERSRRNHAAAAADVERLAQRETDLVSLLADARSTHDQLERRIVEAEAALDAARARTEEERRAAAEQLVERQDELQGRIDLEVEKRRTLEDALTQALRAHDAAEKQHASAITSAAAQSSELEAALKSVREDLAAKTTTVERLIVRESDLAAKLAEATTGRNDFERRLAISEAAIEDAGVRAARERLAAEQRAAQREAELEAQLHQERSARTALEQSVAAAAMTLQEVHERHEVALAARSKELAERQAHFDHELSQATAECARLTAQIRDIEGALEEMGRAHRSAVADVGRLAQREVGLVSELAGAQADRQTLHAQLTEAATAIRTAAERETTLADELRHERATRAAAEKAVAEANVALDRVQRDYQAAAAGLERLTERETALSNELAEVRAFSQRTDLELADAVRTIKDGMERETALKGELQHERTARAAAEQAVVDTNATLDQVRREHESAVADLERLAVREVALTSDLANLQAVRQALEAELQAASRATDDARRRGAAVDEQLQQEQATRASLERALADLGAVLEETEQQHRKALDTAAQELAARQEQLDRATVEGEAQRTSLGAQLRDVEAALEHVRREHQLAHADVQRLTERESELTTLTADLQGARRTLEVQLAEAVTAIADAADRAARERSAAADCQRNLEARLTLATEKGDGLVLTLAATSAAAAETERKLREEADALRARVLEQAAHFDEEFARARFEQERRLAEAQDVHNRLSRDHDALQASHRLAQETAHGLEQEVRETRGQLEQARAGAELERQRLTADRQALAEQLDEERLQFQKQRTALTHEHAAALAARDREVERLQQTLVATGEQLALTTRQRDLLQADAEQLPRLRGQIEESRAENHRAFQQAPMAMFRCTKDGALTQVNRACTILVRRTHDELRNADFAAAVFESPTDLSWLIENCLTSRRKESTETTWRRKDGSRLFVRVSAYAASPDLIECAVEDLTPVRILQDRLSQAHRMEAVGRLAAEVAATCGDVLQGVHENVQQWQMTTDGASASRQQSEMLLEEVSRAAASLRQLAAYGDAETRSPAVVDLKTLVRDLAPVLKRIAGEAVALQLPSTSASLNVDVDAGRVERLLVNIAAHGRERMPFGGRLKIEFGTIVVDRHFTAKHPNVRLGPHALITITEIRNASRSDGPLQLRSEAAENAPSPQGSGARVDLGTLQTLVAECGGHLWMTVQPAGDMVVKMRLPLLTSYGQAEPRTSVSRGRVRTLARWFQS